MPKRENLHYEQSEPAFLQRLRAQASGNGTRDPDLHDVSQARPKRLKSNKNEEEDAPAYVDEEGRDVSKEEFEGMVNGTEENGAVHVKESDQQTDKEGDESTVKRQGVVEVGAGGKKRKAGRVVGTAEDETDGEGFDKDKPRTKPMAGEEDKAKAKDGKTDPAKKKIKKKIKSTGLSFQDDDDG